MKVVNLTPHTINVWNDTEKVMDLLPSGQIARVQTVPELVDTIDHIPTYIDSVGEVEGLPEPVIDTIYVVSAMVRLSVPERTDVYSPGELKRNEAGQPVGCLGLKRNEYVDTRQAQVHSLMNSMFVDFVKEAIHNEYYRIIYWGSSEIEEKYWDDASESGYYDMISIVNAKGQVRSIPLPVLQEVDLDLFNAFSDQVEMTEFYPREEFPVKDFSILFQE